MVSSDKYETGDQVMNKWNRLLATLDHTFGFRDQKIFQQTQVQFIWDLVGKIGTTGSARQEVGEISRTQGEFARSLGLASYDEWTKYRG